jgi:hypothetical protein
MGIALLFPAVGEAAALFVRVWERGEMEVGAKDRVEGFAGADTAALGGEQGVGWM